MSVKADFDNQAWTGESVVQCEGYRLPRAFRGFLVVLLRFVLIVALSTESSHVCASLSGNAAHLPIFVFHNSFLALHTLSTCRTGMSPSFRWTDRRIAGEDFSVIKAMRCVGFSLRIANARSEPSIP